MRRAHLGFATGLALVLCSASPAWATTYAIDKDHSAVSFKVRHLFSKVAGTFNEFEGLFDYVSGSPEQ